MTYEVFFTQLSKRDLSDNIAYIAGVLKNRKAASDLYSRFMKASDDLATNPDSSHLSDIQVLADLGVRVRHIGGYNVYYMFHEEKVVFLRIVSTLMDTYSDDFIVSVIESSFEAPHRKDRE